MSRLNRLILILLAASAFLGWKTYGAWTEPEPPLPGPGGESASIAAGDNVAGPLPEAELAAAVAAIVGHPVLRPDRQPYKEIPFSAAAPQRNYEAEMGKFTVIGILPIDGVEKALVVRKGAGSSTERWELAPGDALPGFVAKEIRPEGVLLAADGRDFLLPLYAGGPKAPAGGPLRTEGPQPALPPSGHPSFPGIPASQAGTAAAPGAIPAPPPATPLAPGAMPGVQGGQPPVYSNQRPGFRARTRRPTPWPPARPAADPQP